MTLAFLHAAHEALPHWSPFAILVGVIFGFVLGAVTMALYALRLRGTRDLWADPDELPDPAEVSHG